ncbi:GroES (chaperonin 10)-like protein [Rhypophila decipiens]
MKAQLLKDYNTRYELHTLETPVLSAASDPHDMLIKVTAASYCHTDHVLAYGGMPGLPPHFPHIGCHEFAGEIVALSPASTPDAIKYKVGDRVGVPGRAFHPCGKCFECSSSSSSSNSKSSAFATKEQDPPGYSVYCPHALNLGISSPGGFREYAIVDSRQVALIPEEISDIQASAMMCAGLTIYAALKKCISACRPNSSSLDGAKDLYVGIIGCGGGLGHLGLQFAIAMGFKAILGVDNSDGPLRLARHSAGQLATIIAEGTDQDVTLEIIDARKYPSPEKLAMSFNTKYVTRYREPPPASSNERNEVGLDAVIILPESQKAFDYGVGLLKNHGKCIVVSFPKEGFHLSAQDLVFRDITVMGSLVGSNKLLKEMLDFAAQKQVKARIKTFPLERLNDLVDEYHKAEGGKLVVDMKKPPTTTEPPLRS